MPSIPPGACDSHLHVFPPSEAFPTAFETAYTPPVAGAVAALAMLERQGLARGVVVQPGVYGTDPAALLDAIGQSGGRLRGVAAVDGDADTETLQSLYSMGVRGLRFTAVRDPVSGERYRGTVGLDALDRLAPAMRATGLHAQLWSPLDETLRQASLLRQAGVTVVLDHMAMLDVSAGVDHANFRTLLDLLDEGWLWVKLSICRVSRKPDYGDVRPFHDALIDRAPHRMLWASDWPFVRMDPAPNASELLNRFLHWVPDPVRRRLILTDNPGALYQWNLPT